MRLLQFSTYSAALLGCSLAVAAVPSFNVRDFGAKGDGAAKDIVSGAVHLKSNVTLYLSPGSVLLASPDNADFHPYETLPFQSVSDRETTYFHYALVAAENVHDIAIVGEGVIDGNRSKRGGPKTVAIKLCERVTIRGITVRNAPNYAISFWGTDYINVDGMEERRAVEDLVVSNCVVCTNCSNFKFGTESSGDFKNVAVTNCAMLPRDTGRPPVSGISLESVDGARISGVVISNITMTGVRAPIFIRLGNRGRGLDPKVPGSIEDVSISNIQVRGSQVTSSVTGLPGRPVRRISLDGIYIGAEGGVKESLGLNVEDMADRYPEGMMWGVPPAWALYVRHAAALTAPMVWVNNVMSALIRGSRVGPADLFLRVGGKSSRDIVLSGNHLRQVRRFYEDAVPEAVIPDQK